MHIFLVSFFEHDICEHACVQIFGRGKRGYGSFIVNFHQHAIAVPRIASIFVWEGYHNFRFDLVG